jgi:hypothetical protein
MTDAFRKLVNLIEELKNSGADVNHRYVSSKTMLHNSVAKCFIPINESELFKYFPCVVFEDMYYWKQKNKDYTVYHASESDCELSKHQSYLAIHDSISGLFNIRSIRGLSDNGVTLNIYSGESNMVEFLQKVNPSKLTISLNDVEFNNKLNNLSRNIAEHILFNYSTHLSNNRVYIYCKDIDLRIVQDKPLEDDNSLCFNFTGDDIDDLGVIRDIEYVLTLTKLSTKKPKVTFRYNPYLDNSILFSRLERVLTGKSE